MAVRKQQDQKREVDPGQPDTTGSCGKEPGNTVAKQAKTVMQKANQKQEEEAGDKNGQKETKVPARSLTRSDWILIQYAVTADGMTIAEAGRFFKIYAQTIRARAKKERWHDIDQIRNLPTTEELIIMRNQSEIIRTLKAMNRKLESAMDSNDPDALKTALSKAELLGRHARATQSLARASEVAASSKRKVKAHAKPAADPEKDRQWLADQLAQIDEKLERAKLPEQSDRG